MELRACYNVLNEADYLRHSVESLINAVDEVIIVEGATPYAPLHKDGLSVDRTGEIIRDLQLRHQGKIRHIKRGLVKDRLELQNVFIDAVPDGTHILFSGGDEIWSSVELQLFRDQYRDDNLYEVYVWQVEFRHDFWHRLPIPFSPEKQRIFKDRDGKVYHNGYIQERIYFKEAGTRYRDYHTHVQDRKGRALYADDHYEKYRMRGDIHFWHFGRLCSRDKIRLKMAHLLCQNQWKRPWGSLSKDEKLMTIERADGIWFETKSSKVRFEALEEAEPPNDIRNHPYCGLVFDQIPRQDEYKLEI